MMSRRATKHNPLRYVAPLRSTIPLCVALLWALSTTQTIMTVRLAWEFSHLVSNCESNRLPFQDLELGLRCKCYKSPQRSSQSCSLLNLEWCLYYENAHNYKPHHIPLKHLLSLHFGRNSYLSISRHFPKILTFWLFHFY